MPGVCILMVSVIPPEVLFPEVRRREEDGERKDDLHIMARPRGDYILHLVLVSGVRCQV